MKKNQNAPPEEFRFGREVQNVANHFRRLGDENLLKEGITITQLRVIAYISRQSPDTVYQKDLEEHFHIRRSSVTGLLQNMEKSGILERSPSETDARVKIVTLTEKGKSAYNHHRDFHKKMIHAIVDSMDETEKEVLLKCLTNLTDFFDSYKKQQ